MRRLKILNPFSMESEKRLSNKQRLRYNEHIRTSLRLLQNLANAVLRGKYE